MTYYDELFSLVRLHAYNFAKKELKGLLSRLRLKILRYCVTVNKASFVLFFKKYATQINLNL